MKRQTLLILAAATLLACSACGKNKAPAQAAATLPPVVSQRTDPSAEPETPVEKPLPTEDGDAPEESPASSAGSVPEEEAKNPAANPQPDSPEPTAVSVDVDLTTLSRTMVYAEALNMMMSPDDYIGKIIRMAGIFKVYQNPETEQVFCGVIVQDATACCAQGFDIAMPGNAVYPQDYPGAESEVTVVGELQADRSMEEYGLVFLRLEHVTFE